MSYYVYVIRLDNAVKKSQKFKRHNPHMDLSLPCFYVGQSYHIPEIRFWQHKKGYKSNHFVKLYGLGICPKLYENYNPIKTRKEAEIIEENLSKKLRNKGHGIWSN